MSQKETDYDNNATSTISEKYNTPQKKRKDSFTHTTKLTTKHYTGNSDTQHTIRPEKRKRIITQNATRKHKKYKYIPNPTKHKR